MKRWFFLPVTVLCAGCLFTASDPEAERAVEIYNELHSHLPQKTVDLKSALAMTPPEKHTPVRLAFAKLEAVKKNPAEPKLRGWGEKVRVELNVLLGFLPSDMVDYDTAGAWNVPVEISHAGAAEKAALIIDGGKTAPLELLKKVRLAHVDVVDAMNLLGVDDSPVNRYACVAACIRLAGIVGVAPEDLDKLEEYEKRFNAASSRWQKSHESE